MTPEHGVPSSRPAMACASHGVRRLLFRYRLVLARGPGRNPAASRRYDSSTKDEFVYLPGRDDPYSRPTTTRGGPPEAACRLLAGPKNLIAHRGEMQHIEALRGKFKFHIVLVSARLFAEK
jgi:hypothetical protein